jgi:hypothetical protein
MMEEQITALEQLVDVSGGAGGATKYAKIYSLFIFTRAETKHREIRNSTSVSISGVYSCKKEYSAV